MAIVREKDVELVKVKNKLEATKKFLATINNKAENKQGFVARHCTGVGSEKDVTCGNAVDDGKNTVDDGKNAVDDGKNAVDVGKNAVDDGKNAVDDGKNAGDDGKNAGDDGKSVVLQPEEKKSKRKRRSGHKKKKGASTGGNNNSADSLEIITPLLSLNKGKSSVILNYKLLFFIINFHFFLHIKMLILKIKIKQYFFISKGKVGKERETVNRAQTQGLPKSDL